MASPAPTAAEIRAQVRERRGRHPAAALHQWSGQAVARFLLQTRFNQKCRGHKIALFRPIPGEVDVSGLESALRAGGARLYYPRIEDPGTPHMEMVEVTDPASQLVRSRAYELEEPAPGLPHADPAELELILVPGVAFGERGERIGRGAGYYDRFLERAPRALRLALAYDFQLFPSLPQSPWDQRVHWIFTQSREIRLADEGSLLR